MPDIGAAELLVIAIVAILVIGPKDMPMALRTAGRWMGQVRRMSNHFRAGIDAMIREAEMEDMEKKWKERNAQIMRDHPGDEMTPLPAPADTKGASPQHDTGPSAGEAGGAFPDHDDPAPEAGPPAASAEARSAPSTQPGKVAPSEEPQLPLEGDNPPPPAKPDGAGA